MPDPGPGTGGCSGCCCCICICRCCISCNICCGVFTPCGWSCGGCCCGCLICVGVVRIVIFVGCFRLIFLRSSFWFRLTDRRIWRRRCARHNGIGRDFLRAGLGDQYDPRESGIIGRRPKQDVIESRPVEQFRQHLAGRTGTKVRDHPLRSRGNLDISACLLAHRAQNVCKRRVGRNDCELVILIRHLWRNRCNRIQRHLLYRFPGWPGWQRRWWFGLLLLAAFSRSLRLALRRRHISRCWNHRVQQS